MTPCMITERKTCSQLSYSGVTVCRPTTPFRSTRRIIEFNSVDSATGTIDLIAGATLMLADNAADLYEVSRADSARGNALLQLFGPVHNDLDRNVVWLVDGVEQESLPVAAHDVKISGLPHVAGQVRI